MAAIAGDKALVSFMGRCFGQRIILTLWYRYQGDTLGTSRTQDMLDLIAELLPAGTVDVQTDYMKVLGGDFKLEEVRAQFIAPTRYAYVAVATPGVIGLGGAATVANDSAALTLRSELGGRDQTATKHVGPIPDNFSDEGLLTPAATTKLTALAVKLTTQVTLGAGPEKWIPIIYHKATQTSTSVIAARIGAQSRVQRRRTVGLGE